MDREEKNAKERAYFSMRKERERDSKRRKSRGRLIEPPRTTFPLLLYCAAFESLSVPHPPFPLVLSPSVFDLFKISWLENTLVQPVILSTNKNEVLLFAWSASDVERWVSKALKPIEMCVCEC